MGALTQYYVDPSIAADSGEGTIGDPFGDVQYALDTITRDGTNGDQINVKAGTAEVLAGTLSIATYGTPSNGSPLVFRGYTSTANDGGVGVIDGAATYAVLSQGGTIGIHFVDMELRNSGAATIVTLGVIAGLLRCKVHGTTGTAANLNNRGFAVGCEFSDCGNGITTTQVCMILGNYISATSFGINHTGTSSGPVIQSNIITVSGTGSGIRSTGSCSISGNSIYSSGGSGKGIDCTSLPNVVTGNLVEGFSLSGVGINANNEDNVFFSGNAVFDCSTAYSLPSFSWGISLGNEVLTESPFVDAANGDFRPVDTGDVLSKSFPESWAGLAITNYLDKGAVQNAPGGGGPSRPVNPFTQQVIG